MVVMLYNASMKSAAESCVEKKMLNPLAAELNEVIKRENPHLFAMLSPLGRRLYFPRGILAQGAEARQKAARFDATLGVAYEGGRPMALPSVMQFFNGLTPAETLDYAPATGRADLRELWQQHLLQKNPTLAVKSFSLPIVVAGLTQALSIVGDMFVSEGDLLLLPDKYWENYDLIFGVRRQARLQFYSFFNPAGGFNVAALEAALDAQPPGAKIILIFNFPNNPTGYALLKNEMQSVVDLLCSKAETGYNLVVICDDAYFGLYYHEEVAHESLFAHLAGAHPRLLAVKADAATKEDFVWGFRIGMLTFSAVAAADAASLYGALEKKVAGAIRSTVSNCSHPAQSILAKALRAPSLAAEQHEKRSILEARAKKVQELLAKPEYQDLWEPYPFNAGYFMCLRLNHLEAERYRRYLLEKYGVGVIADGAENVRVAFAAVELDRLEELFEILASAARELRNHSSG